MIPLVDLVAQYRTIETEINIAIQDVICSGKFILGPNVMAFEDEIANYLNVRFAIGVASGTDALIIALRALGILPGDEVIIPAYSFFATAGSVMAVGAIPVFVDVNPKTFLIDVEQIENKIGSRTKAIMPVHLYGQPADMDHVFNISEKFGLKIIEDNAQGFGATFQEKKTGCLGDVGCLSFFPSKNLGGYGDGGMVVTNNPNIAEYSRKLRTHGWKKKYYPEILGYNSRLDELQASILRVKLKHIDEWNKRRRAIATEYSLRFSAAGLDVPVEKQDRLHVYHLYVIRLKDRDKIQSRLKEDGIATDIYYPLALHLTEPCKSLGYLAGDFPVAEQASRETLALPLYPEMSSDQINIVVESLINSVL